MRLDGYIRVSRVAGREGDSFISPDVQREQVNAYAVAHGHEIVTWHEDYDESGGTMDRPGFTHALERCRNGATEGIIAAKLDRLSRSLTGLSGLIEESKASGWTLVAVDFGLDVKSASGKLVADILGSIAEWERTRLTESWDIAQARAVARGVHIASRTPTGYRKREDGRLEPDPIAAPVIRELFLRRASGEGWTTLATFLDSRAVVGPYSAARWTPGAVRTLIRNRVYLGEARSGKHVNANAHDAIVTRTEWERAQLARVGTNVRKGDGLLLAGLVRCAGCRYLMKPEWKKSRSGVLGVYTCRKRHAAGICPNPSTVLARLLDPHVESVFLAALDEDVTVDLEAGTSDSIVAEMENAERELLAYRDDSLVSVIGVAAYRAGLEIRAARVAEARARLRDVRDDRLPPPAQLKASWNNLSTAERRQMLTAGLDAVIVRQSSRGTGKLEPVSERAVILMRGEAPDDLPRRGHRVPLRSWAA